MKFLTFITLLTFMSCAHKEVKQEMSSVQEEKNPIAEASMAGGKIKAFAVKNVQNQNVCFDITLHLQGTAADIASPSNWTTAWVDKRSRYFLLNVQTRHPASAPQGSNKERIAQFISCATRVKLDDVKSLVLTPKEVPYDDTDGLTLKWD